MLALKTLSIVVGLIALNSIRQTEGITYQSNTYELNVALSEYALDIPAAERGQFLQNMKDIFTQASRFLFEATDYRVYFGKINILIPPFWGADIQNTLPTAAFSYATADVRVEETKTSGGDVIDYLRTKNPKPCGQPGDHIIVPPQFIKNAAGWTDKYGDRVKTFIHEFARFRYGVFEEYGFEGEQFPYSFRNVRGDIQITGCNNTEITGEIHPIGNTIGTCNLGEKSCRFYPDKTFRQSSTTSLMFMHYLSSTAKFCDKSNHDKSAPNRQNHFCRNRSVKTVIEGSRDFRSLIPLPSTSNTAPVFNIYVPAAPAVYVVFDVAAHDTPNEVVFNIIKDKVVKMIDKLSLLTRKVIMGVAKLGATLSEVQAPIQVQGSVNTLISAVNSITRSGSQLNIEQGFLEVGKKMTPFAHLSGSVVLFFKLNSRTDNTGNVESEVLALLNSRSTRLVTFELLKAETDLKSLKRLSMASNGAYLFATSSDYTNQVDAAINSTLSMAEEAKFQNRRITLTTRSINVTSSASFKSWIRNDFTAQLEVNFFIPASATSYKINVTNSDSSAVVKTQDFQSWSGVHKIETYTFDSNKAINHSYEITTTSNTPLQIFVEAAELLSESAPLHLGGGGELNSKPFEIEITTTGDNGQLNMGFASSEDLSFLIYASIKKGAYIARNSLVTAIVQGPTGAKQELILVDKGKYPDILADDGIYSGFFKPSPIRTPTSYTISARVQGYTVSNTPVRSLPIDQENYCCGSNYDGDGSTAFFQRYVPYGATLQVFNADQFKEKPDRITDFKIADYSAEKDEVILSWRAPAAFYGTQEKVDSFKIAYGEDSTNVINVDGFIPSTATLVNDSDSIIPAMPGNEQSVRVQLSRPLSPPPLYFTISSVKNGNESYPAPMVYLTGVPGATTLAPTTLAQTTGPMTTPPSITGAATTTKTAPSISSSSTEKPSTSTTSSAVPTVATDKPNGASLSAASLTVVLTTFVLLCVTFQTIN